MQSLEALSKILICSPCFFKGNKNRLFVMLIRKWIKETQESPYLYWQRWEFKMEVNWKVKSGMMIRKSSNGFVCSTFKALNYGFNTVYNLKS